MEDLSNQNMHSFLSFKVGNELFAANVDKVLSILDLVTITRVPGSPPFMLGIINLRGAVLPVIDSRIRFGIEATPDTRNTCIIVMEVLFGNDLLNVGILVDAVHEVIEVKPDNILPPPGLGNKYKADFIKGIIQYNGRFIILLDVDTLFSSDELLFLGEDMQGEVNPETNTLLTE